MYKCVETILLGEAVQLDFNSEGRVILQYYLMEQIEVFYHNVISLVRGYFKIWNPDNFKDYHKSAKEIAQDNRSILKR